MFAVLVFQFGCIGTQLSIFIYNYTYNHHQLWYTVWTTVASWLYESPKVTSSNCLCVGPRSQVQVSLVSSWNYVAGCFGMFHLNPYWVPIIPSTAESTNQVISAYYCVGEHVAFISLVLRSDDPTFQNWINNMQHMYIAACGLCKSDG